ncbi:MAG: ExeA family protein [Deferribacterales bacterium]
MLAEEAQIDIAQSSFKLLLQKGIIPKWIDKKQVEGFVMTRLPFVMQSQELTAPQIWDYAEQEQGKRFVFEASEDDYAKKLKTYMEITMLRLDTMRHFKLAQNPFILDIRRESEIFMGSSHQFAFEVMKQTAETGGFAVITGEVGAGKSTVRRKFFEDSRQNKICQIIYPESIDKSRLTAKDVLYSIIYDLTEAKPQGNKEALSRQAKALLLARSNNNERTVLVIEEAHDLPVTTLKFLKRIWELENGLQRLLGIILIGQNELETRLYGRNSTEIREVTARTAHARVEALGKEMPSYIAHKFKCAKADVNRIISPEALKLLVDCMKITDRMGKEKSMGYPLFVSNVMIRLMNYAAEAGEELITPEIIETVGV